METKTDLELIAAAISGFPAEFGLRAYSGKFRVSPTASYVSDGYYDGKPTAAGRHVQVYTQRYDAAAGRWVDFAKGTAAELKREVIPV